MKKAMRKMICMVLVGLLTVSTVVPAMAEQSGSGTDRNGYVFSWRIFHDANYGYATISTNVRPTNVTAEAYNLVYDDLNKIYGMSKTSTVTGYVSATAMPNNEFNNGTKEDPDYHRGIVEITYGTFWVGNNIIANEIPSE